MTAASPRPSILRKTNIKAAKNADPKPKTMPQKAALFDDRLRSIGPIKIITPTKPTSTAPMRCRPTFSPMMMAANIVMKIGIVWLNAVARLRSIRETATNQPVSPAKPLRVRSNCTFLLLICRTARPRVTSP